MDCWLPFTTTSNCYFYLHILDRCLDLGKPGRFFSPMENNLYVLTHRIMGINIITFIRVHQQQHLLRAYHNNLTVCNFKVCFVVNRICIRGLWDWTWTMCILYCLSSLRPYRQQINQNRGDNKLDLWAQLWLYQSAQVLEQSDWVHSHLF